MLRSAIAAAALSAVETTTQRHGCTAVFGCIWPLNRVWAHQILSVRSSFRGARRSQRQDSGKHSSCRRHGRPRLSLSGAALRASACATSSLGAQDGALRAKRQWRILKCLRPLARSTEGAGLSAENAGLQVRPLARRAALALRELSTACRSLRSWRLRWLCPAQPAAGKGDSSRAHGRLVLRYDAARIRSETVSAECAFLKRSLAGPKSMRGMNRLAGSGAYATRAALLTSRA